MREKDIYRISTLLGLIGIVLLYLSGQALSVKTVSIGSIGPESTGKKVAISGRITDYTESGGNEFMTLKDGTGKIKVVRFDALKSFGKGSRVDVKGSVQLYHGELEIVADSISHSSIP
ncbi:MAG: OB-fold nucleic acid binding domain-containing protein [Candidatus Nanohaloarchaea archaeon]